MWHTRSSLRRHSAARRLPLDAFPLVALSLSVRQKSYVCQYFAGTDDLKPEDNSSLFDPRVVREGLLQRNEGEDARCLTCNHRCLIQDGKRGLCGTRIGVNGRVTTLCYGNISSISNNPIEKKPFFHFAPGTMALTVGSWGCNATCLFCQNYEISKRKPTPDISRYMSPEEFVDRALLQGSEGTSISLNEAATLMLEWNIEVFKLAHERGLYNSIVTNGYMTDDAVDLMADAGLDAANVDIKGCAEAVQRICGLHIEHVWDCIAHMKKMGVHVELTTLVVPGLSDDEDCLRQIASRIVSDFGPDMPWHVNRFFPYYRYKKPKTPIEVLLKARDLGRRSGLHYVYIGNALQQGLEDTICPRCGNLCYNRYGLHSTNTGSDAQGRCARCGLDLGIVTWSRDRKHAFN